LGLALRQVAGSAGSSFSLAAKITTTVEASVVRPSTIAFDSS